MRGFMQQTLGRAGGVQLVSQTGTREGRVVAPFLTSGYEGFNIDDEEDWDRARRLLDAGEVALPEVERPYPAAK